MVRPWDLLDVGPEPIVPAAQPELPRLLAELHVNADLGDLFPGNANTAAASNPSRKPPDEPCAPTPNPRAAQDRHDFQRFSRVSLQREVVDLATPTAFRVEQLVIEDVQPEVDRLTQFWPTFVRIISGIAVSAMTRMTTR